jgi:hypothetical protein
LTVLEPLIKSQSEEKTLHAEVYKSIYKASWDNFVSQSKNGVFLFFRDYLEYHSNRFLDHSLLFFKDNELVAVLPANLANNILYSHGGLTFGGVISGTDMSQVLMLEIFDKLIEHCQNQGITRIIYKPTPHIYHTLPAEEDLYALYLNNAKLTSRIVASTIYLPQKREMKQLRKRTIKKALKNNLIVKRSYNFKEFMKISQEILKERHDSKPVHSVREIEYLAAKFPENIKLFASYKGDEMLAGVVMYENNQVVHAQYAANSSQGWDFGAEDIIFDYLIKEHYSDRKYFDFGSSNEKIGQVFQAKLLNNGLINYKEGFGASSVMYDLFSLDI